MKIIKLVFALKFSMFILNLNAANLLSELHWIHNTNSISIGLGHSGGESFYAYGFVNNPSIKTYFQPKDFSWFSASLNGSNKVILKRWPFRTKNPPNVIFVTKPLVKAGDEYFSLGQFQIPGLFKNIPDGKYELIFYFYLYEYDFRLKKTWNPFIKDKLVFKLVALPPLKIPVQVGPDSRVTFPGQTPNSPRSLSEKQIGKYEENGVIH